MTQAEMQDKIEHALQLEREGRFDEAVAVLDDILAADPKFPNAHKSRGNNWFWKNNLDRAIEDHSLAAELMPDDHAVWHNLGVAYLHQADRIGGITMQMTDDTPVFSSNDIWYRKAIDAFTRSFSLQPEYSQALVMRAFTHTRRLDDERAQADFTAAAERGDAVAFRRLFLGK